MQTSRKTERLFNLLIMLLVQSATSPRTGSARSSTPTRGTRRSRRCSSVTRRSCAASASRSRSAASTRTSTTSPATGSAPTSGPPRDRADGRRGRRGRARHQGVGPRPAGGATTEAVRKLTAYGVPVDVAALDIGDPRIGADEPAFDVFWAAALERTRSCSTTAGPGVSRRPGTCSRGGSCGSRAAGTPWGGTPTATTSGSSGCRGSSGRRGWTAARQLHHPARHRHPRDRASGSRRRRPPRPPRAGAPGAGAVLRRQRGVRRGRRGRARRRGLGPAGAAAGSLDARRADRARARPGGRGAGEVRDEVVRGCARWPGGAHHDVGQGAPAARRTRWPACCGWCPSSTRATGSGSTTPRGPWASTATQVLADLKVLLMCGLPGGYPDDLIDVDLDALETPRVTASSASPTPTTSLGRCG